MSESTFPTHHTDCFQPVSFLSSVKTEDRDPKTQYENQDLTSLVYMGNR